MLHRIRIPKVGYEIGFCTQYLIMDSTSVVLLEFLDGSFDAVIVLNGTLPSVDLFLSLADLPVIAADGAANTLLERHIIPEFIVGDLDSVTAQTLHDANGISEIVADPDQDTTDFEKCLHFAKDQLWKNILVVGMHGGLIEHTLNNWSVLMRHCSTLHITALDADRWIIPIRQSFSGTFRTNETLSIIPQPSVTLTTRGLVWELTNEELALGQREGARNRAATENITVNVHRGSALLVCDSRLPLVPIFHNSHSD